MAHHYSEDETDYYKILQIPRSATLDDIRKSYKKLAVIYHPDKNAEEHRSAAAEKFKKIAAAYEVLSDPEKRAMYDRYGHVDSASASHHGGRGGDDDDWDFQHAQDIFNLFFRDFGSSSGGGFSRSSFFDDDFFGGGRLGGGGRRDRGSGNRRGGGFHSSFMDDGDDDLFGGRGGFGFGGLGRQFAAMDRMFDDIHSSSFSSNSSGGTWKGGVSRSTSTTTRIENGKRVTKTTTTVKHADGSVETSTNESIEDAPMSSKRYIDIADGADSRRYLDDGRKTDRRLSIGAKSSRK